MREVHTFSSGSFISECHDDVQPENDDFSSDFYSIALDLCEVGNVLITAVRDLQLVCNLLQPFCDARQRIDCVGVDWIRTVQSKLTKVNKELIYHDELQHQVNSPCLP